MLQPANTRLEQELQKANTKQGVLSALTNDPRLFSYGSPQLAIPGSSSFLSVTPSNAMNLKPLPSTNLAVVATPGSNYLVPRCVNMGVMDEVVQEIKMENDTVMKKCWGSAKVKDKITSHKTGRKSSTNLATMAAGGSNYPGHTSTRPTLQLERVDPLKYSGQSVYISSNCKLPYEDQLCGLLQIMPCRVDIKVMDEVVQENKMKNAKVVKKGWGSCEVKDKKTTHKTSRKSSSNLPSKLPPLPLESELFGPEPELRSRKEKSLALLAEKILAMFPLLEMESASEIDLVETAKFLDTDTRRIHWIVSVFEALHIMSKVGKNIYSWYGFTHLVQTLAWLRQLAYHTGMATQYTFAKDQELAAIIKDSKKGQHNDMENVDPIISQLSSSDVSPGMSQSYDSNYSSCTSVGINTQKFIMLLLVAPEPKTITLEFATIAMHGSVQLKKQKENRIRRLCDISNILTSLGLLRKVRLTGGQGKRNAFQYVGPNVDNVEVLSKTSIPPVRKKNSLLVVERSRAPPAEPQEEARAKRKLGRMVGERKNSNKKKLVRNVGWLKGEDQLMNIGGGESSDNMLPGNVSLCGGQSA